MANDTEQQQTQELAPAAASNGAAPPKAAPLTYRAEFLVETAEGFHVMFVGEQLTPRDFMAWTKTASAELAKQGFKPVRRDVVINLPAAAPASASATNNASGDATWIQPTKIGEVPRCSLHGDGQQIEGTYKSDHARAGQSYKFWGCKTKGCRPKGKAVPD